MFFVYIVILPWMTSLAMQNVRWTPARVRIVLWGLTAVATGAAGIMLFQVAPGVFDVSLRRLVTLDRGLGFYFHGDRPSGPNAVAFMAAAGVGLSLTYLKYIAPLSPGAYALLMTNLAFLVAAGGRNAWVSAGGLLILFAFIGRTGAFSVRSLLGGSVVLLAAAVVVTVMLRALLGEHGYELQDRLVGLITPADDHNARIRLTYWARAVVMILARPSGWGFDAYYAEYERTPHNELLGQLIGGGLLGTVGFVALVAVVGARSVGLLLRPSGASWRQAAHYAAFSMLCITALASVTEHISRAGMATFYPLVWVCVGVSYGASALRGKASFHDGERSGVADAGRR
jgi:O-antigen ligase